MRLFPENEPSSGPDPDFISDGMEPTSRHRGLLQTLRLVAHFAAGYSTLPPTFPTIKHLALFAITCSPQKSIRGRILDDLNELHASNQWENLRRIQVESGTTSTVPARVDLSPAKHKAQESNIYRRIENLV